ncbi:MAG TPA: glycosyltransferase [candidate division Zixibacteria bacterium]|nr:glycosyltransferase [candidate division Zixibacteria bacterium]
MSPPAVSIILFAHAPYAGFIPESLGSILNQSYRELEVIVLGDGSRELEQAVEPFRDDPRCMLSSQGDRPFLLAANDEMKQARGRYLGTWNSDDVYAPDHVKVLVEALDGDPALGGAFDNTEYFGADGTLGSIVPPQRAGRLASAPLTVRHIFRENIMTGPSSLVRKSAFERVGGYDGDIYLNCDLHWFYRIAAYFPVRYVDYVGVRKRVHPLNNTAVNPHYEFGLKELEHIRDHYPDVYRRIGAAEFNKKLGRKYFRLGLYYERRGEREKARAAYREAMRLRKWSLRYAWEYLRCGLAAKPPVA